MKKILRKLKKGLGKAAKVAIPVGAAFLAAKALKRRKTDTGLSGEAEYSESPDSGFLASGAAGGASLAKQDRMAKAIKAMTSNDAYSDDTMPGNLSRDMGIKRKQFMPGIVDYMAKGGRAGHKSGGKVKGCGKALRGFGKAMKGKR
jgi:hypothetical protein